MDETPPLLGPQPPAMPLAARLLNLFAIPGQVFAAVKAAPVHAVNWWLPALLGGLVSALGAVILFAQSPVHQKLREQVDQQAANYETLVQDGKLTREAAERATAFSRALTSPPVMKTLGVVVSLGYGLLRVFWWAAVLWLLARWFLQIRLPFGKVLEVAGLAGLIGVLGALVIFLLQVNLGNPAVSPELTAPLDETATPGGNPMLLIAVLGFDFWQALVLALALARLADVAFARGALVMFGFWMVFHFLKYGVASAALGWSR